VSRPQDQPDSPAGKQSSANRIDAKPGSKDSAASAIWKRVGLAVFALAAAWYLCLISLAAITGNPVTLNRVQLRASSLVVAGTVDEKGVVSHILVFKGIAPEGEIVVTPFPWPPGNYILPLRKGDAGRLEVTPSELPDKRPLVYPANDKSIEQLQQILK
jgi:hypothetical protein